MQHSVSCYFNNLASCNPLSRRYSKDKCYKLQALDRIINMVVFLCVHIISNRLIFRSRPLYIDAISDHVMGYEIWLVFPLPRFLFYGKKWLWSSLAPISDSARQELWNSPQIKTLTKQNIWGCPRVKTMNAGKDRVLNPPHPMALIDTGPCFRLLGSGRNSAV